MNRFSSLALVLLAIVCFGNVGCASRPTQVVSTIPATYSQASEPQVRDQMVSELNRVFAEAEVDLSVDQDFRVYASSVEKSRGNRFVGFFRDRFESGRRTVQGITGTATNLEAAKADVVSLSQRNGAAYVNHLVEGCGVIAYETSRGTRLVVIDSEDQTVSDVTIRGNQTPPTATLGNFDERYDPRG